MTKIYRIAKAELSLLFYSPIAWFILIVFAFQSGLIFIDIIKEYVQVQEGSGTYISEAYGGLTHQMFDWPNMGFFNVIQARLYLYIPLLTMGLMSRELSSGSIKLLLSSPVKIRQIIVGKYVSMLVYCLLFVLILLLYVLTAEISVHSLDTGKALSGVMATYLLICTYSAIGLFMSSLTSYQIIAAISSLVLFAGLEYIEGVGQNIAVVRTITYFLSLRRQTYNLNAGLISSSDVLYYIITITLFLFLAVMRLNDEREARPLLIKSVRYTLLISIFLFVGYVSSRTSLIRYYDITANKSQTLSPASQQIIRKLAHPVKVIAYTNLLDDHAEIGLPERRNVDREFWQHYTRFMPDMEFNYLYYYDTSSYYMFGLKQYAGLSLATIARKDADRRGYDPDMFHAPAEMKAKIDLDDEDHRFVRVIESGNQNTFLRVFNDPVNGGQPLEDGLVSMLKRLIETPPKILFLTGHNERNILRDDPDQYRYFARDVSKREALINQGFDVDTLSLENTHITVDDTRALVVAEPKTPFTGQELKYLEDYIDQGGNMLIAADTDTRSTLKPLLEKIGISQKPGFLVQVDKHYSPDHIEAKFTDEVNYYFNKNKLKAVSNDALSLDRVVMNCATGLDYEKNRGFLVRPIVAIDTSNSWNTQNHLNVATGPLVYKRTAGDDRSRIPTAIALTRIINGKEQRIIVSGDADFLNNQYAEYYNNHFILEMFKWFSYGAAPVNTDIKFNDIEFRIKSKDVSFIKLVFLGILPATLLFSSIFLSIKRRRV